MKIAQLRSSASFLLAPASRIALADPERSIRYGDLPSLVGAEAVFLAASGGKRFSILAENGCGWALSDLALAELGALNVPLPTYFTQRQLHHLLDDAGIDTILTDRPEEAAALAPGLQVMERSPASGLTLVRRTIEPHALPPIPAGTVKITYTSGSTSEPKGVCLGATALACVSRSLAQATAALRIERHVCLLPLATLLENLGLYAPLLSGASCTLLPAAATGISYGGIDVQRLLAVLERERPESLILVPELLKLLVAAAAERLPFIRRLRFVAVGGAPVSRALLVEADEAGLPVYEGYGLSECASVVCLNTPDARRLGSVGRPLPHAQVHRSRSGELIAAGAAMHGYLGDGSSWYPREIATGDVGEVDEEGFVYVTGRLRNLFISSMGRNVSPEWLERELTCEPPIRHAIVRGEAQPYATALLAISRPDPDGRATREAVERANARLPDYARIRHWRVLPEAPSLGNGLLTANGRLRRAQVLERFGFLLQEMSVDDQYRAARTAHAVGP